MKNQVLAFGIAKEIVGDASVFLTTKGITVAELRQLLEKTYPQFKTLSSYMIAVNNEYAMADFIIKDGDEVAIIPPVSGG